ncbi:MAG TPA: GDSL-type esterase/lipase family protein [Nocardioides sp.]|uniref:GDSL-type esterase/lipase family protein n=1 Tax=Nocardioides sp. TaxID=35761 RepID=UPI002ED83760
MTFYSGPRRRFALAVLFVLGFTACSAHPSPAHAAEPTRVLIVGDSVTQGSNGDFTWRYFAWQELAGAGRGVDFVGPYTGTHSGDQPGQVWGGSYADAGFDQDHAARWGKAMWEQAWWPSEQAPSIAELMTGGADVVVLALGVNDLRFSGGDVASLRADTVEVVRQIRAVDPSAGVVLGAVPQSWVAGVNAWNAALPGLAAELATGESTVVATNPAGWTQADTTDNLHPNTVGQQKLATTFVQALTALTEPTAQEPTPEPTAVPVPSLQQTAPSPAAKPVPSPMAKPAAPRGIRAVQRGARIRVAWRAAAGAESYAVRCGRSVKTVGGTRAVLRVRSASCKVRATNAAGSSVWERTRVRA